MLTGTTYAANRARATIRYMFTDELACHSPASSLPPVALTGRAFGHRAMVVRRSGRRLAVVASAILAATLVATVGVTLGATLGGCAGSARSGASGDYTKAYESGRYTDAFDGASVAAAKGSGIKRDNAALIAGLSAQALNRNADAEKYLRPLIANPNQTLSGEAGAALGLIASERGDHADAAALLSVAGRKLDKDQAARAFMYAGDSYKSAGQHTEARGLWSLAQSKVTNDSSLRIMIGDRLSQTASTAGKSPSKVSTPAAGKPSAKGNAATPFCVQVGAFSSFTNAQKQLGRFRAYGAPRVVEVDRAGQKLFAVRVGTYTNRAEAESVAKNIGKEAKVMLTTGE